MKQARLFPNALNNPCPYCHAKAKEPCRVINNWYVYTEGGTCRDGFGNATIHEKRISKPNNQPI